MVSVKRRHYLKELKLFATKKGHKQVKGLISNKNRENISKKWKKIRIFFKLTEDNTQITTQRNVENKRMGSRYF